MLELTGIDIAICPCCKNGTMKVISLITPPVGFRHEVHGVLMTNTTGSSKTTIQKHSPEIQSDRCGLKRHFCLIKREISTFKNSHQNIRSCTQPEDSPLSGS
jgi:hypothetical protein